MSLRQDFEKEGYIRWRSVPLTELVSAVAELAVEQARGFYKEVMVVVRGEIALEEDNLAFPLGARDDYFIYAKPIIKRETS